MPCHAHVMARLLKEAMLIHVLSSVRMMGNGRPNIALFLGHCKICKIYMYEAITVAYAGQPAVKETG